MKKNEKRLDPLYVIFKKQFHEGIETDLDEFVSNVIADYINHLEAAKLSIPEDRKRFIIDQLAEEVEDMIRKTFMGCLNPKNYMRFGKVQRELVDPAETSEEIE